ncbi:MAG TPA: PAS domain-containing sensor histidine kinase [Beijerinckiaceae bacterium]|nr:PAS domain-containing sensor histidine kinase [Beijerinckiaceae bacterium]
MNSVTEIPQLDPPVGRARRLLGYAEIGLFGAALVAAAATIAILMGVGVRPSETAFIVALAADILLALLLVALVGVRLWALNRARKHGQAGARLHLRIVTLLGLVAGLPTALVALFAMITLERGLNPWFSGDLKILVENSDKIARQFQQQLCQNVVREMRLMAVDVERAVTSGIYQSDRKLFREYMTSRAVFLSLPFSAIIKPDGQVLERAELGTSLGEFTPNAEDFAQAATEEPPCIFSQQTLGTLTKLRGFDDGYLIVGRPIDRRAIEFPLIAQAGVQQYQTLDSRRAATQLGVGVVFVLITLIVLLAASLLGLRFADRLVQPVRRLIMATDAVSSGNLYVQVPVGTEDSDIAHLGSTFNNMTSVLRSQHNSLLAANQLNDQRRRFMEAVLSGVPAGVVGIDGLGRISIANPTAERLLGAEPGALTGRELVDVLPQIKSVLDEARIGAHRVLQETISLSQAGRDRTLSVRIAHEASGDDEMGLVVTLDDITDLVTAQRTSAWADVARRIAHEIKNPLTPIQLSAERIRRKFGKVIAEDKAIFDQCTDTIVRQVEDIKRMVDEFSSFARMPKPRPESEDIVAVIKETAFMMRVAHPDIVIEEHLPAKSVRATFDRRLIAQAMQNIIKNAAEAIAAVPNGERGPGRIELRLFHPEPDRVAIDVIDNGKGFPSENRDRLLEPYMTTRESGTGLGLAIVAKILEEHGGGIELRDAPSGRGACVRLLLPSAAVATPAAHPAQPTDRHA